MRFLAGWDERITRGCDRAATAAVTLAVPRCLPPAADRATLVATADGARSVLSLVRQRPVAFVGVDAAYRYDRPGVPLRDEAQACDPRSIRPLLLSLAVVEAGDAGGLTVSPFVVDLRGPGVLGPLGELLGEPVPFVGHDLRPVLFCLFRLDVPEPRVLWDTRVFERAARLGRGHVRYRADAGDQAGQIRARGEAEASRASEFSLSVVCLNRGVAYAFAGPHDRLRSSFLTHPAGASFSDEQVDFVAAGAVAASALYQPQVLEATRAGLLHHLQTVEMPWVATTARTAWHGVRFDREKCDAVEATCRRHGERVRGGLAGHGVTDHRDRKQLESVLQGLGLLDLFRKGGGCVFDRAAFAAHAGRHPVMPLLRSARRIDDLLGGQFLRQDLDGADGRVHPDYRQLGADTGRQSCRWPNVLGLDRVFRPLVVPDPGRGIGEVDWCQIEVGISAAVYGDDALAEKYNTGDVYSAMAQEFYRAELSQDDLRLDGTTFKGRHRDLRDRMKACTLGIIYGLTPRGLARQQGVSVAEASRLQGRFLGMFPAP